MRIGITGTRSLDKRGRDNIVSAIAEWQWREVEGVIVGGCVGADAWAGATAKRLGFWVRVILPENPKELDPDWETYADEADGPYPYRERNQHIVDECDELWAFPEYPEQHPKSRRSGTWQTIRMAQRQAKPVHLFVQSERHVVRPRALTTVTPVPTPKLPKSR